MKERIWAELKEHAPFTFMGALSGVVILAVFAWAKLPGDISGTLFDVLHPGHVLLSAMATTAMFRRYGRNRGIIVTIVVGYVGAIAIGTVSDCLIPALGEALLGLHDENVHAHLHIGFIEHWWVVNPLALLGVAIAWRWPNTHAPHTGHVLLSTWASLFHMMMAMREGCTPEPITLVLIPVFLFLAVWVPCCTSDIIFPVLAGGKQESAA